MKMNDFMKLMLAAVIAFPFHYEILQDKCLGSGD